ncbi:hypothetical protein R1Y80_00635 [Streptomyces sp. JL1001]|uniref:4Fe-4S Wbl-type domain-containing protein n=1 Tax=Streptomyces sp. JL1001 TaxID=3078227 RepID=A0AAU8KAX5_9ACTN
MSDPTAPPGRRTAAARTRRAALADAATELATSPAAEQGWDTGARTACTLTGDTAYQALLGHTLACPDCRNSDGKCESAAQLDSAWRQARGAAPLDHLYRRPTARSLEGGAR